MGLSPHRYRSLFSDRFDALADEQQEVSDGMAVEAHADEKAVAQYSEPPSAEEAQAALPEGAPRSGPASAFSSALIRAVLSSTCPVLRLPMSAAGESGRRRVRQ